MIANDTTPTPAPVKPLDKTTPEQWPPPVEPNRADADVTSGEYRTRPVVPAAGAGEGRDETDASNPSADSTRRPLRGDRVHNVVDIRDGEINQMHGVTGERIIGGGVGAAVGSTAGAIIGSVVPLAGTIAGAAIGAVVGAALGSGVASLFHPHDQDEFWRMHYKSRPYYEAQFDFERDYAPAYRFGYTTRMEADKGPIDAFAGGFEDQWMAHRGMSRLSWEQARPAIEDAWARYEQILAVRERGR